MSYDEHNAVDPGLNAIENALGALTPSRSRLDRDRLMFRAGQVSARPTPIGKRLWIAVAAGTGLIALGEAAMLAHRPAPQIIEKVIVVRDREQPVVGDTPTTEPIVAQASAFRGFGDSPSFGPTAYERLNSQVFRYGLDGLPTPPSPRANADSNKPLPPLTRQLWQEELLKTLEPGAPS
ncbi:hypothetical protein [Singulisphaera acidiphila]|uniref:Uncharacterized protein n=1 Tax=Singulisphaera acidiphila (strain ATCC BAA-1392 / DSM 18658 / VKM B-2454 / MOB10) TaxID=886293 RepID=L0D7G3_SINAD|nr:hypothetical protein [Singulisphaera acidiphila]AGA25339.1 hypothetical protein Sinac_0936 [Singulisphaera acidiphila DSM 18658]